MASTLNEVGNLELSRLRYDDAAAAFRRTVEIYRHAYGDHHSNVAIALGNLGSVYMSSGDCPATPSFPRLGDTQFPAPILV